MSTCSAHSWYSSRSSGRSGRHSVDSTVESRLSSTTCDAASEHLSITSSDANPSDYASLWSCSDAEGLEDIQQTQEKSNGIQPQNCGFCRSLHDPQCGAEEHVFTEAVFRATSGSQLSSYLELAWIKDQVRKVLVDGQLSGHTAFRLQYELTFSGACGAMWTRRALEYRMLEGGLHLAAATALLPNDSPMAPSLALFLYAEIVSRHSTELVSSRNTLGMPSPFAGFVSTSDIPSSLEHRMLWAMWAQVYARWLLGEKNAWDSWQWEHWAPRPVTLNVVVGAGSMPTDRLPSMPPAPVHRLTFVAPIPVLVVPLLIPNVAVAGFYSGR